MAAVEKKLRRGMTQKGIPAAAQEQIVRSITSFALYGFPESHAASFALITYASAYLKCHYLAAFMAAMLNNQPMGFYHPSTLIKDAQRHGLHFRPVDVTRSEWPCAVEEHDGELCVRLGFNYVKGLRRQTAAAIVEERAKKPFVSIDDLTRRVPAISKDELNRLAELGALNFLGARQDYRRGALWQSGLALRPAGPLLAEAATEESPSPLEPMTPVELLSADFRNTGVTIGRHPMRLQRKMLKERGVVTAREIKSMRDGKVVRVAGAVICRQRPGTAKGFVFLTLEDETGIVNIILQPRLFDNTRATTATEPYLLIDGVLQNQGGVVSVKAGRIRPLDISEVTISSHDFC